MMDALELLGTGGDGMATGQGRSRKRDFHGIGMITVTEQKRYIRCMFALNFVD